MPASQLFLLRKELMHSQKKETLYEDQSEVNYNV